MCVCGGGCLCGVIKNGPCGRPSGSAPRIVDGTTVAVSRQCALSLDLHSEAEISRREWGGGGGCGAIKAEVDFWGTTEAEVSETNS